MVIETGQPYGTFDESGNPVEGHFFGFEPNQDMGPPPDEMGQDMGFQDLQIRICLRMEWVICII